MHEGLLLEFGDEARRPEAVGFRVRAEQQWCKIAASLSVTAAAPTAAVKIINGPAIFCSRMAEASSAAAAAALVKICLHNDCCVTELCGEADSGLLLLVVGLLL